jgi:hypothetical protein
VEEEDAHDLLGVELPGLEGLVEDLADPLTVNWVDVDSGLDAVLYDSTVNAHPLPLRELFDLQA